MNVQQVRRDLTEGDTPDLWRRRAVVGLSLAGMAAMAPVTLLQTGAVRHLPDPPLPGFDSDKVNRSEEAYRWGVPDGTLALLSLAANVPLAAWGGADRARRQPWAPLAAAAKAAADAAVAAWYFYQMPTKEKAWCPYCIAGALANFGILALTLPEAARALEQVGGEFGTAVAPTSLRKRTSREERNQTMVELNDLRVAAIVTDGFEESELLEPMRALRDAGARVDILAPQRGKVQAFRHFDKGTTVEATRTLDEARPDEYDALLLPGGALNADALRLLPRVQFFVRAFQNAGKPMAVICHAPWLLVSADLVRGRRLTSYHTIQDDIRNAGGEWFDQEVVEDDNWVTSRQPSDIPAFNRAMLRLFARRPAAAAGRPNQY